MKPFRNILVGVDLSAGDRLAATTLSIPVKAAIRRAIWLASQTGAKVTFLASLELDAHTLELLHQEIGKPSHNVDDMAREVLAEIVKQAEAEGVSATSHLAFGKSWKEIIGYSVEHKNDLVIVGIRDRSRAKRVLFGSTAMKLIHFCPSPVWVVRPDPNWDDLKILVATDFSPVSQTALEIAVGGAELSGADIHLLHSIEEHAERELMQQDADEAKLAQAREKERAEAEQKLRDHLASVETNTLKKDITLHLETGPASEAILKLIDEYKIDLLVMGTQARGGIKGMFIGNTAEKLLPDIPCALMAIKPDDYQCPVSSD